MDEQRVTARPMNDRVLVKVMEHQKGSARPQQSGMFFLFGREQPPLEQVELEPARGIIVSVGPGYVVHAPDDRHYVAMDVKVGDEILFFEDHGLKLKINDEELYLLNEGFILVVLSAMDGRPAENFVEEEL